MRIGGAHPLNVTPSWYGDSIGRYEGDTLVIDTIGIKPGRYSMVVQDGVVKSLNVEDAPGKADVSGADNLLKSL